MLKKLAAVGIVAGALVLAAPVAASAATDDSYAEQPKVTVDHPIVSICEVSTITFGDDYFQPGEKVAVAVSGKDAARSKISGNTASSEGGLVVTFRPPQHGNGSYSVAFDGTERDYTATITVNDGHDAAASCDHDPGVAPAGTELPLTEEAGMELALTGGSVSPWVLGGGALALAAGGTLVAVGAVRRRRA